MRHVSFSRRAMRAVFGVPVLTLIAFDFGGLDNEAVAFDFTL